MIPRKRDWTHKPPQGVRPQWNHPLLIGHKYFLSLNGGNWDETGHLYNIEKVGTAGEVLYEQRELGIGCRTTARTASNGLDLNNELPAEGAFLFPNGGSFFCVATLEGGYTDSDEHCLFSNFLSGSGFSSITYSTSVPEDGLPHSYGLTWPNGEAGTARLYFDGLEVGSVGITNVGNITLRYDANQSQIEVFFSANAGDELYLMRGHAANQDVWLGTMFIAVFWELQKAAGEMCELHANPWQLYSPERFFVPIESAGGVSPVNVWQTYYKHLLAG